MSFAAPPLPGLAGRLAPDVVEATRRAGEIILALARDQGLTREAKPDGSPLTAADLASNRLITATLAGLDPGLPVLSEEAVVAYAKRKAWSRFWLIDPLDGTKEFLAGNGQYCVCVALIEDRRPVLGVICEPLTRTVYLGAPGAGAYRQRLGEDFEPIGVRAAAPGEPPLTLLSRSHADPALEPWLDAHGPFRREALGSALKFCRIAEGRAQHYARLTRIHEWDVAAGQALIEGAGARMRRLEGGEIIYNTPDLLVPPFVVDIAGV